MAERRITITQSTATYLAEERRAAQLRSERFRGAVDALLLEHGVTGNVELVGIEGDAIVVEVPDPEEKEGD